MNQRNPSLHNLIKRVLNFQPEPFIAPLLDAHAVQVTTAQKGLVLTYNVQDVRPGWYLMNPPRSGNRAYPHRPGEPSEIIGYLRLLRSILVIALYPLSDSTWLVTPYRAADASQRGWQAGAPAPLHLVRGHLEALDVVTARVAGSVLLFDEVNSRVDQRQHHEAYRLLRANHEHPRDYGFDLTNAYEIVSARLVEARRAEAAEQARRRVEAAQREAEARRSAAERTIENRIRSQVEFMGAHLDTWINQGTNIQVTWTYNGYTHTANFNRGLNATSLGICMAGTDHQHNISTAIAAIEKARELHHHDLRDHWTGGGRGTDLWHLDQRERNDDD